MLMTGIKILLKKKQTKSKNIDDKRCRRQQKLKNKGKLSIEKDIIKCKKKCQKEKLADIL